MKKSTFNYAVLIGCLLAFLVAGGAAAWVLSGTLSTPEHKAVKKHFAENYELSEIKFIDISKPVPYAKGKCSLVRVKFKAPGFFGGPIMLHTQVFEVRGDKAEWTTYGPAKYHEEVFDKGMSADEPRFQEKD